MATSLLTRVKARVDLHTSNRARGLVQGRGRSLFKGSGEDFDDLKYYQPGRSEEHTSELQSTF